MFVDKKRLLITGVSGLLGSNLAFNFRNKYDILGLYYTHPVEMTGIDTERCDLRDSRHVKHIIAGYDPHVIIHGASLTDIEGCEANQTQTREINVASTQEIVHAVMNKTVKLIYISSDSVYDGVNGDFAETDHINPLNFYGKSKYEGETAVQKKPDSLVLRTNIFGWNIQNKQSLGEWIVDSLRGGKKIQGFEDAFFSTIYTLELARVLDVAIESGLTGLFNCGSTTPCSKYEFAMRLAEVFGLDRSLIVPISVEAFGFKAKRGKRLNLNVGKLEGALNYRLPTIDYCIEAFYRDYKCGVPKAIKENQTSTEPNSHFISYGRQWIDQKDIDAVADVLRSYRITQGPRVDEFEQEVADYCGAKYCVAVNSGTSALHIACLAAGIAPGFEVITSPNTFVASANCVVYSGGTPLFADIDPKTYNIDPAEIDKRLSVRTRAVLPVHFAGQSCDMDTIYHAIESAGKRFGHKIFIIEDGSHALGSTYKGTRIGSCAFSDMTVMSFHPVKHITTGEGGAVLTNDARLYQKLRRFRSHGITSNPSEFVYREHAMQPSVENDTAVVNPWYYEQIDLGYNYRLTDIQAVLGICQLKKIDMFKRRRRDIVNRYNETFKELLHVHAPFEEEKEAANFHLYVLLFDFEAIGLHRAQVINDLKQRGIQTQVHYIPVHTQPYYQTHFQNRWGDCPEAERYYQRCLSIPLYPAMCRQDVDRVINEIIRVVEK